MVPLSLSEVNGRSFFLLFQNAKEHVRIDGLPNGRGVLDRSGMIGGGVKEEDVKSFFDGFDPESVVHDHTGYYVTFSDPSSARRATLILEGRTLSRYPVKLTVCPPPHRMINKPKRWSEKEERTLIKEVREIFVKQLRSQCEKDVRERVAKERVRMLVAEERNRREIEAEAGKDSIQNSAQVENGVPDGTTEADKEEDDMLGINVLKRIKGLKGLSFKRKKQEEIETSPLSARRHDSWSPMKSDFGSPIKTDYGSSPIKTSLVSPIKPLLDHLSSLNVVTTRWIGSYGIWTDRGRHLLKGHFYPN